MFFSNRFSLPVILEAEHQRQYFVMVLSEHYLWSVAVVVAVDAVVFVVAVDDVAADLFDVGVVDFVVDAVAAVVAAVAVRKKAVLMLRDVLSLDARAPGVVHVEVVASIVFVMLV